MAWDPRQYLSFAEPRFRAGMDLIAAIRLDSPERVLDLGCGTGDLTAQLSERWPAAQVTGVDRSEQMLALAAERFPGIDWELGDLRTRKPTEPVDLIYSNASLQWVGEHELLVPKLLRELAAEGALALQVPNNFEAPSHRLLRELALDHRWAGQLSTRIQPWPVLSPERYIDLLSPMTGAVDAWTTTYFHLLNGKDPVLRWMCGAGARPYLAALRSEEDRERCRAEYGRMLREAYPERADGSTLLPYERTFVIAYR